MPERDDASIAVVRNALALNPARVAETGEAIGAGKAGQRLGIGAGYHSRSLARDHSGRSAQHCHRHASAPRYPFHLLPPGFCRRAIGSKNHSAPKHRAGKPGPGLIRVKSCAVRPVGRYFHRQRLNVVLLSGINDRFGSKADIGLKHQSGYARAVLWRFARALRGFCAIAIFSNGKRFEPLSVRHTSLRGMDYLKFLSFDPPCRPPSLERLVCSPPQPQKINLLSVLGTPHMVIAGVPLVEEGSAGRFSRIWNHECAGKPPM